MAATTSSPVRVLGRYALYDRIASGGMATVHFGRLLGPVGFARTVAIKRLHAQFAQDPEFVSMFLDEARLAGRIRHPNVVPTLDVVTLEGEIFLVMEYVQGEPLGALIKATNKLRKNVPIPYGVAIISGALRGLYAAHEAKDEQGNPLGIVHRDVSPQNILVGVDGVPRVLDFGVAKAAGRIQQTREGQIKGKIAYMPPEQLHSRGTDRRTDVYAAGAVLWETLTGKKLFQGDTDIAVFAKVVEGKIAPPSQLVPGIPPVLDAIILRALARSPDDRFQDAREMARALEEAVPLVSTATIGEWVEKVGAVELNSRSLTVSRIEVDSSISNRDAGPQSEGWGGPPVSMRAPAPSSAAFGVPPPFAAPAFAPPPFAPPFASAEVPADRTEVSGSSVVHSAVIATRLDRRWVAIGGAGGGIIALVLAVAVIHGTGGVSAPQATSNGASPPLAPAPAAPAMPATLTYEPSPAPPPAPTAAPVVATAPVVGSATAPTPLPSVASSSGTRPTAVSAPAEPRPHRPAHPLDAVLDSRK